MKCSEISVPGVCTSSILLASYMFDIRTTPGNFLDISFFTGPSCPSISMCVKATLRNGNKNVIACKSCFKIFFFLFCFLLPLLLFFQVIFYEERDFMGPSVECTSECRDLLCQLNRCNSIRVESGAFMIYDRLEFAGTQYLLRTGDYPDYHSWLGCNDSVRSCRLIPAVRPTSTVNTCSFSCFKLLFVTSELQLYTPLMGGQGGYNFSEC